MRSPCSLLLLVGLSLLLQADHALQLDAAPLTGTRTNMLRKLAQMAPDDTAADQGKCSARHVYDTEHSTFLAGLGDGAVVDFTATVDRIVFRALQSFRYVLRWLMARPA